MADLLVEIPGDLTLNYKVTTTTEVHEVKYVVATIRCYREEDLRGWLKDKNYPHALSRAPDDQKLIRAASQGQHILHFELLTRQPIQGPELRVITPDNHDIYVVITEMIEDVEYLKNIVGIVRNYSIEVLKGSFVDASDNRVGEAPDDLPYTYLLEIASEGEWALRFEFSPLPFPSSSENTSSSSRENTPPSSRENTPPSSQGENTLPNSLENTPPSSRENTPSASPENTPPSSPDYY